MKSNYSKPTISFQNIALATAAGAACVYKANFQYGSCVVEIPEWGEYVWDDSISSGCTISTEDFGCYNVPTSTSNIFDS